MRITILGLGYIGLPTAAIIAQKGLKIYGVDVNKEVVDTISAGKIHIKEPGLEGMVQQVVADGMLEVGTQAREGEVYLIVVPTPFKGKNEPDISYVRAAIKSIIKLLKPEDLIIIESTSPIGTTELMTKYVFEERSDLIGQISVAYCPERVLPGNVLYELINNDRVIGGIDENSTHQAVEFYKKFVTGELHQTNARTAEMCKLVENSSRDVQIAFANELSLICDKADINVWELIDLANKHPRVNILQPGSGVGGHCIAVDPYFIVSEFPLESQLIGKAREINNYKTFWVAEKIKSERLKFELEHGRKAKLALMGLAFKPDIDDLRESPAKYVVQKVMQDINNENIFIVEPNLVDHNVFKLSSAQDAINHADIIAYLVSHSEFKKMGKPKDKVVLDFSGVYK